MAKKKNIKINSVQFFNLEQLKTLDPSSIIVVNRVALNSKRVQIEYLPQLNSKETVEIVAKAAREMRLQDRRLRRPSFGANMTAKDAITVFSEDVLPKNTFASMCSLKTT